MYNFLYKNMPKFYLSLMYLFENLAPDLQELIEIYKLCHKHENTKKKYIDTKFEQMSSNINVFSSYAQCVRCEHNWEQCTYNEGLRNLDLWRRNWAST